MAELDENYGVDAAIEHLQELAKRMKCVEFNSTAEDFVNINSVIESLQELATDYSALQEKLETESIEASVLRHKLKHYPQEIQDEINRAIAAARHSNGDEMGHLRAEWQAIEGRISNSDLALKQLQKENSFLIPERDRVRAQHELTIVQLNERMSEKAACQIHLNETRAEVHDTNQKILDLEDGILQLQDELVEERAAARLEKKRLKKEISDTVLALQEQLKVNATKKSEMDKLSATIAVNAKKLDTLHESTTELEVSCNTLEAKEENLRTKLDSALSAISQFKQEISTLNKVLLEEREQYMAEKTSLESKSAELDELLGIEAAYADELESDNVRLEQTVQDKLKRREADEERVKEVNRSVQQQKAELAQKAERLAQLHADIAEVEEKLGELASTHSAVLDALKKTADECNRQLGKERKERMELDSELEEIERGLEFLKMEARRFQDECRKIMMDGKQDHDKMTQEGYQLQSLLKESQLKVKQLHEELTKAQFELNDAENNVSGEVQNVEKEIQSMKAKIAAINNTISDKKPDYEELQKVFSERTSAFELAKKNLASMKNKKVNLEDNIRSTSTAIEKTAKQQAVLRQTLTNARAESLEKLKDNMSQLQLLEQEIYSVDCKLVKLVEENSRFTKAVAELEAELKDVADQKRYNELTWQRLLTELDSIRLELAESWAQEEQIQQTVSVRDGTTVLDFEKLVRSTDRRQMVVDDVTARLESELELLAEYLDKVARRRPKDVVTNATTTSDVTSRDNGKDVANS